MQLETPIIIEKKLEEFNKLASIGKAVSALVDAAETNNYDVTEIGELIINMAVRRMRKNMPAYKAR